MPDGDSLGLVGQTIADKYAVERVVGEGGFATVYRAMHVVWKRPVALKVFKALGVVELDRHDARRVAVERRRKLLTEKWTTTANDLLDGRTPAEAAVA